MHSSPAERAASQGSRVQFSALVAGGRGGDSLERFGMAPTPPSLCLPEGPLLSKKPDFLSQER